MDRYRGSQIGVVIQCENGNVVVPNYSEAFAFDRTGAEVKRWQGGGNHHANFLAAIEARDPSILNGEIQEGHLSSALCHTGGVSHQLGENAVAGDIAQRIVGEDLLSDSFERMASHLRANGVDIDNAGQALTVGPWLEVDTETERFIGNDAANQLRSRKYREPFTVSDYGV